MIVLSTNLRSYFTFFFLIIFLAVGNAQFRDASYLSIPQISELEVQLKNKLINTKVIEKYKKIEQYKKIGDQVKLKKDFIELKKDQVVILSSPILRNSLDSQKDVINKRKLNFEQVQVNIQKDTLLFNYYVTEYLVPLKEVEQNIYNNEFGDALKNLYYIYHPGTYDKAAITSLNKVLEAEIDQTYGIRRLDIGIDISKTNHFELLTPDEIEVHKERIGRTLLNWGNNLFINGNREAAIDNYLAVLRLYPAESEILLTDPRYRIQKGFDYGLTLNSNLVNNPEKIKVIGEALRRLYYELRGADFVGFDETSIPIWAYSFLRETTKEFLTIARDLERNLYSLMRDENAIERERMVLENSIEMAEMNIKVARNRVGYSQEVLNISRGNSELAKLRLDNRKAHLAAEDELTKFAADKQKEIQNTQFWSSITSAAVNAGVAYFTAGTIGGKDTVEDALKATKISSAGGSGAGGVITSAIFGKSINKAQNAIQEKQNELQRQLIEQELAELEAVSDISLNEIKRDSLVRIEAKLNLNVAITNKEFQEEQLIFLINSDQRFDRAKVINESKRILETYLGFALYLAQQTEKAYQIEELDDTKVIRDELAYFYTNAQNQQDSERASDVSWLASDKILLDLNTLEFRRITRKKQKENYNSYFVSIKNKAPFDLEELRRTGKMTFDITQYDLDISFPGTYRHLIEEVDVTLIALADPTDINMQLTKESLSWTKVPNSFAGNTAIPDWFQSIPSNYSMVVFKNDPETLVLPRNEQAILQPGLKEIFEGKGVCGTYTLEIPKYSNSFNYGTIFDVIVEIKFSSYFDPILKGMIEAELCQIERRGERIPKRVLSYSMPIVQPDDWYVFQNPTTTASLNTRIIPFYFYNGYLPYNQHRPKIDGVSLATSIEGEYIPINYQITSASMNPNVELLAEDGTLNNAIDFDNLNWYNDFHPSSYQQDIVHIYKSGVSSFSQLNTNFISPENPYELWLIRLDAAANDYLQNQSNNAAFDEEKIKSIKDLEIAFNYTFSFDYCESEPRILAAMNINEEVEVDTILRLANNVEVPYLNVRTPSSYDKSFQDFPPPFEWVTDLNNKSFLLDNILPEALEQPSSSNPIGSVNDLIPFNDIINIKGSVESIELDFDLKNIGTSYFYLHPNRIRLKVSKDIIQGKISKTLEVQADTTIYENPSVPYSNYRRVKRFNISENEDFQVFTRYVNLPDGFSATIELFVIEKQKSLMTEVFDRPIPFERIVSNPQQTNFRLVTMGRDSPKANLILKNIVFRDYSVR